MTEFALVGVLGLGWLLMLAQPLFVARESRSYLRSIGQFQRSLDALGAGLQPPRRTNPSRGIARRRQRALVGLVVSVLIGLALTPVSVLLGAMLVAVSITALVAFVRVCAAHPVRRSACRETGRPGSPMRHVEEERAIA